MIRFRFLPAARAWRVVLTMMPGLFAVPETVHAGHTTTAFADIEPGPRIMAMGGAGAGLANDPTAAWWNPAGLYFMRGTQGTVTYDDLYGQGLVQRNYVAVAWKKVHYEPRFDDNVLTLERDLNRGSAFGFSVSSLFVDLDEASYSEFMPTLSYAGGVGGGVGIGASVSFLKAGSDVTGVGSTGYSSTVGISCELPWDARLGYAARNLFSSLSPEEGANEKLPITSAVGISLPIGDNGIVAADATFSDGDSRIGAGGEFWLFDHHLAPRAGVRHYDGGGHSRVVPTFGVGLQWKRLNFDYGLTADETDGPGTTHRFGLNVLLGRPR